MPRIEVLPNSKSVSAPGWAYVPDTGFDPSKVAIQPSGSRHRAARNITTTSGGHERSARLNNAITKHLNELDKDNHRDVQIAVPVRQRDGAGRVSRGKVTPAVRKILASQKTFANHLADEEAALVLQAQTAQPQASKSRQSIDGNMAASKVMKPGAAARTKRARASLGQEAAFQPPDASLSALPISVDDNEPLLRSSVPAALQPEVLEELLSAPPLSYAAARAAPPASGVPHRQFCEICGYWGRVKCLRCGGRVCGLECKNAHGDSSCGKLYA